jgi:hypothetical protein
MLKLIAKIISIVALVALIIPSCLYFVGKMNLDHVKNIMFISTIVWFVTASIWMSTDNL